MEELSISEARENFSEAVEDAQKKPVQILKHGKPVAVLINPSLFEKFLDSMEELEDIADFDKAIASKPSQSPMEEKTMAFQSLRNAGIAKTPRVSSCAGAAGLGSELM